MIRKSIGKEVRIVWSAEITIQGRNPVTVSGTTDDVAWLIANLYESGADFLIRTIELQE